VRRVGTVVASLLLLALTACGEKTIEADGAEKSVVDVVSTQTGFRPTDVSCPDDVEAKEGKTFDCRFTGPEGPYVAHMTVTKVDGSKVIFQIKTERSGS
jgi:Domain of unknown function (DUF4333)